LAPERPADRRGGHRHPGLDTSYATNTQTTGAHKIVIECLGNLDQLPATGSTLVLGILRLKDGSGSPLSVMAFVP
jgi:kynurenine formamidase